MNESSNLDVSRAAVTLSGDESLELPEFDSPPLDPIGLLRRWLSMAEEYGVREPRAMVLSTVSSLGRPSGRVLLLKDLVGDSLVFTTSSTSKKGGDMDSVPWASMTFYWRETMQQITISGRVERLSDAESDALFAERPREAQITTAVSKQSRPLEDEAMLHQQAQALRNGDGVVSRPTEWFGYRLMPESIEFWQGRSSRLHRRLEYTRDGSTWTHQRLQP